MCEKYILYYIFIWRLHFLKEIDLSWNVKFDFLLSVAFLYIIY